MKVHINCVPSNLNAFNQSDYDEYEKRTGNKLDKCLPTSFCPHPFQTHAAAYKRIIRINGPWRTFPIRILFSLVLLLQIGGT